MFIGSVVFDLHIPYANSLKSKRMVVKSFKEKLRSKFNVSVAEIGGQDTWQTAQIAVVTVAQDEYCKLCRGQLPGHPHKRFQGDYLTEWESTELNE